VSASQIASSPNRRQPAERAGANHRLAGLRALVVEDEMFVAWHMEEILEQLDIEVCGVASNAEAGVDKAGQMQPDVVLMDVNLGAGPDGVETARQIARLTKARILFVTAYSDPELTQRIKAVAPAAPILQKPASSAMIEAALLDILD
jgi:DNA-binding NarL/FixJ family response regulator